jgi:hypothetical protein
MQLLIALLSFPSYSPFLIGTRKEKESVEKNYARVGWIVKVEGEKGKQGGNLQQMGLAEVLSGVDGVTSKLFLDTEKLVVLGQTLRAAGSTSLDLTGTETDDDIGNGVVLGLTGAVRDHDAPSGLLGKNGSLFCDEEVVVRRQKKVSKKHGERKGVLTKCGK